MQQDKKAKRTFNISWWKIAIGGVLIGVGILFGFLYLKSQNPVLGILATFAIAPGAYLVYTNVKGSESGFYFSRGKRKYSGEENAIVWFALRDPNSNKDIPRSVSFVHIQNEKIPKGARQHYVRNLKKHFYELYFNTLTRKLEPFSLPDKKASPPELFKIPATMQPYKDCMEFNPPSLLQKVAPGILLLAMGLVGLIMLVTGD